MGRSSSGFSSVPDYFNLVLESLKVAPVFDNIGDIKGFVRGCFERALEEKKILKWNVNTLLFYCEKRCKHLDARFKTVYMTLLSAFKERPT